MIGQSTRVAAVIASSFLSLAPLPSEAEDGQDPERAQRAAVVGDCATTASRYKVSFTGISTSLNTYQDVAQSAIFFAQGKTGCLIVAFSAEARAGRDQVMYVRPLLDEATICQPNAAAFVASGPDFTQMSAHAMNFICPGVAPGNHTVKMQYLSFAEGEVFMTRRTTLIHYVK